MRAGQNLPPILWPLTAMACLGFGGLALLLGMDAGWDLRNHHYYNGWAFLHGLVGKDLLVAQSSSFLNPALDAAYALLADTLPAWAVGFLLGMVHGLNFPLLFAIGWRVLEVRNPGRRVLAASALALAGVLGAGGLSQVGIVGYDNVVSLGLLGAVVAVTTWWDDLADGDAATAAAFALAAGLPAGLAAGLHQPAVIFALGLCLAFVVANLPVVRRLWLTVWFGVGVLVGLGIGGGHWMAHLWQAYGNPLFPLFNQVFHSPWAQAGGGPSFLHSGVIDLLTFGWRFPFEPTLAGGSEFRDFRILAVLSLLPLVVLASLGTCDRDPAVITMAGPTCWLLAVAAIAYAAWAAWSGDYRRLAALEMLAPLLVAGAVGCLPLPRAARRGLSAALVAFLMATTLPGHGLRVAWADSAVEASVPPVDADGSGLVLLSGREPLSFLIPRLPGAERTRFLRIDSSFAPPDAPGQGFRKLLGDAVAAAAGPIRSLHAAAEEVDAARALAEYGLELDRASCRPVTSPIGNGTYRLCLTTRPGANASAPAASAAAPSGDGSTDSAGSPAGR